MRSYLEIMIDIKDGKDVDKEELRVALLFCRDMLFFTEQELERAIDFNKKGKVLPEIQMDLLSKSFNERFNAKKSPIENWWKGNIPQIKK